MSYCRFMKQVVIVMLLVLVCLLPTKKVRAASNVTIRNNNNGTITLKYNNTKNIRTKVLVQKGDSRYQYELKNGNNNIKIPLTQGNGRYKVILCEQIEGTSYAIITQRIVTQTLNPTRYAFRPTHVIINFTKNNAAVKKAKSLTKKIKQPEDKIKIIYEYIVKNYKYDYAKQKKLKNSSGNYVPNINSIYKSKKGICYDIAAVYASMLRSIGIETKLVTGFCDNIEGYHAWNKVYDAKKKKWITMDLTYDICMFQAKRSYSMNKDSKEYSVEVYQY